MMTYKVRKDFNDDLGSSPKKFGSMNFNKQDFTNYNLDIARSQPQMLHFAINKVENNLRTDDLPFCKPQVFKFQSKRATQPTNPICPDYKLASFEHRPKSPTKFIKDTLNVQDIEKAAPKKFKNRENLLHNYLDNSDVQGSQPRPRIKERKNTQYDYINYQDIHVVEQLSFRRNPLNPTYTVISEDGKPYQIGHVHGSNPKSFRDPITGNKDYNKCDDIVGAAASTRGLGVFEQYHKRTQIGQSPSLTTDDVAGAKAGSLGRGIRTTRNGNPLNTNYQYPGHSELESKSPYSIKKSSSIANAAKSIVTPKELVRKAFEGPKSDHQKLDQFVK